MNEQKLKICKESHSLFWKLQELSNLETGKISNQFNVVTIRFLNIKIAYTQGKVSLRKPKKSDYPL